MAGWGERLRQNTKQSMTQGKKEPKRLKGKRVNKALCVRSRDICAYAYVPGKLRFFAPRAEIISSSAIHRLRVLVWSKDDARPSIPKPHRDQPHVGLAGRDVFEGVGASWWWLREGKPKKSRTRSPTSQALYDFDYAASLVVTRPGLPISIAFTPHPSHRTRHRRRACQAA